MKIRTTKFISYMILSINCHIHFWKVFWSIKPADAPTAEYTGLSLGCTFKNEGPEADA
jgi:hypothetical protein